MRRAPLFLPFLLFAACATGQARTPAHGDAPDGREADAGLEPYEDVVSGDAVADSGLFTVHWDPGEETLLFEIPDSLEDVVERVDRILDPENGG